jgi:hypothetical protein
MHVRRDVTTTTTLVARWSRFKHGINVLAVDMAGANECLKLFIPCPIEPAHGWVSSSESLYWCVLFGFLLGIGTTTSSLAFARL